MTILSVNKTRELMGALRPFYFVGRGLRPFFVSGGVAMLKRSKYLAHAAILAALYAVLTHLQNVILPGSATWAIQMRLSEALCVLAFFTPAAPVGLAVGCLIFNLTFAAALPLDFAVGALATYLAGKCMWHLRDHVFAGLLMPAVWNALLVGWELTLFIGSGFWINALYVAIGEAAVLLTVGALLYRIMKSRKLDKILFG